MEKLSRIFMYVIGWGIFNIMLTGIVIMASRSGSPIPFVISQMISFVILGIIIYFDRKSVKAMQDEFKEKYGDNWKFEWSKYKRRDKEEYRRWSESQPKGNPIPIHTVDSDLSIAKGSYANAVTRLQQAKLSGNKISIANEEANVMRTLGRVKSMGADIDRNRYIEAANELSIAKINELGNGNQIRTINAEAELLRSLVK